MKHKGESTFFCVCVWRCVCNVIAPVRRAQAIFQRMSLCFIGHRVLTVWDELEMLLNVRERVNITAPVLTDLYDRTIHLLYCFTGSHIVDRLMRETSLPCNMTHTHNLSKEDKSTGTHSLRVSHRHTPAWSVDRPINGASLSYFITSNWCEIGSLLGSPALQI